jgi:hypothetical protein
MKITHCICPRGCGKTSKAEEIQMEDPDNIIIIKCYPIPSIEYLMKILHGRSYKKVIFDEFLHFASDRHYDRDSLMMLLVRVKCEELILFSTQDRLYNEMSMMLTGIIEHPEFLKDYKLSMNLDEIKKTIEEYNSKFLNPSKVDIIRTDFNNPMLPIDRQRYKREMPADIYKAQILGEFKCE